MKNIRLYAIVMLGALFAASCDLDRFPETDLSDASFWATEDNFMQACNTLYTLVDGINDVRYDDIRSDFAFSYRNGANEVSSGTRIAPSTSADWDKPYEMIFNANKIIEKAAEAQDVKSINRWIGEAKFWRAYAYYRLVSKFGDVPLVLNTLDIDSPELEEGRTERALIVQQIYDDLDDAAANLPAFTALGSVQYGRTSKSAALALKARVALYEGTRQKFHNYGQPDADLTIAISAAEAVMASGHQLYTAKPYFNLFQYDGEGFANKENILSVIFGVNDAKVIRSHNLAREIGQGGFNVTRPMIEQYLCTDGLPYDKSPLTENPETGPLSIFKNKDPRMGASLFKEGDTYNNPDTYPLIPTGSVITGFNSRKYYIQADWINGKSYIDIAMIRYAEALLIYAEAKFELNGSISDADLDKSINLLRGRVSMPHLTNAFVAAHGLDMRTEIRRERNVELAQEGFRYDDINRWKIAEDVLPKEMVGATYFPIMGASWNISDDGYLLAQTGSTRFFDPAKDYLYPIPTREISLSGGSVTQNPDW
jgi:hypothetical protein